MRAMLALAVALFAAPAAAQVPLRVGIPAPTVNMLPMWVAQEAGFFDAGGLAVEIVDTGGGSRGLAMLRAGELQIMNVGLSAVIDENGRGADFRMIAASTNTMSFGFFGAPGITAAGLRGQKVGVSTLGSESDVAATLALRKLGLGRGDVVFVETGATMARLDALMSGAIAATALNEPVNLIAQQRGIPKLAGLAEDTPWILNGIVVRREAMAAQRETLLNFLRAYTEAIHFALANPERTQAILAARFGTLDPAVAKATYDDFRRRIPRDAVPSLASAGNMIRELPALGVAVGDTNTAAHVEAGLIEALRAEGFFDALRQRYGTR